MDRLMNLVHGSAHNFEDNDSLLSSDFNWNDISVGNDTIGCEKFFRVPAAEFEQALNDINEDINNVQIAFEETVEADENNSAVMNRPQSVDSRAQTSFSSEEGACGEAASGDILKSRNLVDVKRPNPIKYALNGRPKVPHVVLAGQMYEEKKKQRMAQIEQKEREQRQFHAKRAPNFNMIHAARAAKRANEDLKVTVPITPKVVHNHRKNLERIRSKLQEDAAARQPKLFSAKAPDVLVQAPFVPQQTKKTTTETVPFNFHGDERMRKRQEFNEEHKQETERREKEREEKRKAEEEQIRREIRKATTFKARPNPFA